jgi:hypothetical protein
VVPKGVLKFGSISNKAGSSTSVSSDASASAPSTSPRQLSFGGVETQGADILLPSDTREDVDASARPDDLLPPPLQLQNRLSSRFSVMPSTYEELAQDIQPKDSKVLAAHFAYIGLLNKVLEKDLALINISEISQRSGTSSKPFARRIPTRTLSASLQEGKGLLFNYLKTSLIDNAIKSTSTGGNERFNLTLSRPKCLKVQFISCHHTCHISISVPGKRFKNGHLYHIDGCCWRSRP